MQLRSLIAKPVTELRAGIVAGTCDVGALLAASEREGVIPASDFTFLRCFTPSLNRLPQDVLDACGGLGPFLQDLALRRLWHVGPSVYQPLAVRSPLPLTEPVEHVDLLVRRKQTIEPAVVMASGSPLQALLRALDQLAYLRRHAIREKVIEEVARRSTHAGVVAATDVRQALVVARPEVYAAGGADMDALRALRAQLEPGALGFRFLEAEGQGDDVVVRAAPGAFSDVSLVRSV